MTVSGTWLPSSWHRRVIPTFLAITPLRMNRHNNTRHTGRGGMFALRLCGVLLLCLAVTELDGKVTVTFTGTVADDRASFKRQDGDRHVAAILLEQAGHPDFLSDHADAHDPTPSTEARGTIPECLSARLSCVAP